ncbi:MAG: bifunctional glycosyltransferase family 2/GtrA family protein [Candidatus Limiplasma sp.]|nr:bifunctional glycosyltransferase family 2/GtrA family protein [Candidatus Limiplasma sp.]
MPNEHARDVAILIPSYQPDERLAPYVHALCEAGFARVVVVDDGSGEAYSPIFDSLAQAGSAVQVIRYEPNHGKGYALREGMRVLQEACPACAFVVTADSDGQHTVADVLRMAEALHTDGEGLLLGSRDFSLPNVPPKSRMGNRITAAVFRALYGQYVGDTQTGLRGFARKHLARFQQTRGDRYEYEMNQLIDCSIEKIPIRSLPIETVYENNNEGSHFHPVRDSWRIYRVILSRFMRFIAASLLCFVVDYGLYLLLNTLLKANAPALDAYLRFLPVHIIARIAVAALLARVVSSVLNFFINRTYVFSSKNKLGATFLRYACTVVVIVALSAWLTSSLHVWFGWNDNLVKMPVDIGLFFLSYYVQRRWVFGGQAARDAAHNVKKGA